MAKRPSYEELRERAKVLGRDILSYRHRLDELRKGRRDWGDFIRVLSVPVFLIDADCNVMAVNRSVEQAAGRRAQDFTGRRCYQAFHNLERPHPHCPKAALQLGRTPDPVEMDIEALRGTFLVSCLPLPEEPGHQAQFIHLALDITRQKQAEHARLESERLYRLVAENISDIIWTRDMDLKPIYISPSVTRLRGFTVEEAMVLPLEKNLAPGSLERALQAWHDLLAMEKAGHPERYRPVNIELELYRKDGSTIWMEMHTSLMRDEEGRAVGILGVSRDLTAHRQAQEKLRASEENYRAIFNSVSDAVVVHDSETGEILDVNERMCEMFGYTVEEARTLTVGDISSGEPPYTQEEALLRIRNAVRKGRDLFEWMCKDRAGNRFWVEVNLKRAVLEGRERLLAVVRDISTRKQTEKTLRESEEKYRLVVEHANEAIIVAQNGTLKYANPQATRMTGYSNQEFTSQPFISFIHPDDRNKVVENYLKRLSGESFPNVYPFRVVDKSGKVLWAEINAVRVDWEGKPATLNFLTDISRRKEAEETREMMQAQILHMQKMEAIGTLAGGVAHDFNNLLTGIQGYTDLAMLRTSEADPVYRHLKQIRFTAARAAELIRQLLLFSRRQPMELAWLNINKTIEDLLKMLHRLIGENIAIETHLDPELWTVRADPGNIEQVIMNLAVNSRDAMPQGGTLTIRTGNVVLDAEKCGGVPEARPGRFVCLTVEDNGVGIEKGIQSRIFEPFFSTKAPGEGTGLGLSTVYGIVQEHKGWVNVSSEPGQGAIFTVYLPAFTVSPEDRTAEMVSLERCQGKGERILLVEDEKGVREFSAALLRESGYRAFEAADLKEAFDHYEKEEGRFDLVFSDIVLPDSDGVCLADTLLAKNRGLKILLTSGYTDDRSQPATIRRKGYHFIRKPYTIVALLLAIQKALRGEQSSGGG